MTFGQMVVFFLYLGGIGGVIWLLSRGVLRFRRAAGGTGKRLGITERDSPTTLFDAWKEFRAARLSVKATKAMLAGHPEISEALYRESLELMESGNCGLLQTAVHAGGLVGALEAQGRGEEGLPVAERIIPMVEAVSGDDPDIAEFLTRLLAFHLNYQSFDEARPVLRRVVARIELLNDPTVIAKPIQEIAREVLLPVFRDPAAQDAGQRLAEAEVLFRRSLEIHDSIPEPDPAEQFWALNGFGNTVMFRGRFQEAEQVHHFALSLLESKVESNHALYARAYGSLGEMYFFVEDFVAAEDPFKQALSIMEKHLGHAAHPELLVVVERIAETLRHLDRVDEAEVFETRAAAIRIREEVQEPEA